FSGKAFDLRFPGEKAKAVGCNAMFYDLSDPNSFVAEVKAMLAPDGIWCIQLSYLPFMLTNMNFYDICHEHLSYYSLDVLKSLMERNGLAVADVSTNGVNGGSLRAFVVHADNKRAFTEAGRRNMGTLADKERALKVDQAQTFRDYFKKIQDLADRVNEFVNREILDGGEVFVLGASPQGEARPHAVCAPTE